MLYFENLNAVESLRQGQIDRRRKALHAMVYEVLKHEQEDRDVLLQVEKQASPFCIHIGQLTFLLTHFFAFVSLLKAMGFLVISRTGFIQISNLLLRLTITSFQIILSVSTSTNTNT